MELFSEDDIDSQGQEYQLQIDQLQIGPTPRRRVPVPVAPLWKDYPSVPNQFLTSSSRTGSQVGSAYQLNFNVPAAYLPTYNYRSSSVASVFGGNDRKTLLSPPRLEYGPVFPPNGFRHTIHGSIHQGPRPYDLIYKAQRASDPFPFFSAPLSRSSSQSSGFVESQQSVTPPLPTYKTPSVYSEPYESASASNGFIQRPTSYPSATWRPRQHSPPAIFGSVKPRRPRNLAAGSKTCSRFGSIRSAQNDYIYSGDEEDDTESFVTSLTSQPGSTRSSFVPSSIRHRKINQFQRTVEKTRVEPPPERFNWKKLLLSLSILLNICLLVWIFTELLPFDHSKLDTVREFVYKWGQYLYEWFNLNHNGTSASQFQVPMLLEYAEGDKD